MESITGKVADLDDMLTSPFLNHIHIISSPLHLETYQAALRYFERRGIGALEIGRTIKPLDECVEQYYITRNSLRISIEELPNALLGNVNGINADGFETKKENLWQSLLSENLIGKAVSEFLINPDIYCTIQLLENGYRFSSVMKMIGEDAKSKGILDLSCKYGNIIGYSPLNLFFDKKIPLDATNYIREYAAYIDFKDNELGFSVDMTVIQRQPEFLAYVNATFFAPSFKTITVSKSNPLLDEITARIV